MGSMVDCDVTLFGGSNVSPEQVYARVGNHSQRIQSHIDALTDQATRLRDTAENILKSVDEFSVGAINPIEFNVALGEYERVSAELPPLPDVFELEEIDDFSGDAPPTVKIDSFSRSDIDGPAPIQATFHSAPDRSSVATPPPRPEVAQVSVPEAPNVDVALAPLPDIGTAPAFSGAFPEIQVTQLPDLELGQIVFPDDSVLDRLNGLVTRKPELNEYTQRLLPNVMTAVGALLGGSFILDMEELEAGTVQNIRAAWAIYTRRMQTMWSRRGWAERDTSARAEHVDRVLSRLSEDQRKDWLAAVERWRMKLLPVALQLGVEAHSFATDMLGELYDLEFAELEAEFLAQISLFDLAVAKYNIARIKIEARLAEYRFQVEKIRAQAQLYSHYIRQQEAIADMNRAQAQAYSAEQEAKVAQVGVFRAQVDAARAVIEAYNSMMRGVAGKAEALKAKLIGYEAEVTQWRAELADAKATFETLKSENRAIIARNRARAAQVRADASNAEAVAFAAVQSAAETSAQVAQAKAQIAEKLGQYVANDTKNEMSALKYTAQTTKYRQDSIAFEASLLDDRAELSAITNINSEVARTVSQVANAATRAAELTQQYRSALADAYVNLYGTLSEAEAARVTGRVAGYRASVGLSTRGEVYYSSNVSKDLDFSESYTSSQSNSCQTIYEPTRY